MFNSNDKLTITLINARDINGNILPFQLKLPLSDEEYELPEQLVSIDVFEYQEGLLNGGNIVFSIYIGEITTINKLQNEIYKNNISISKNIEISSIDSPICINQKQSRKIVFASLKEQDIVVENKEQLMIVIEQISNDLNIIKNSTKNIKNLSKKYKG